MEIEEMEKLLKNALEVIQKSKVDAGKTKRKKGKIVKEKTKKPQEIKQELPYSDTTPILTDMKIEELISRFGILYNQKTPYSKITSASIVKFYDDYNIKAYKRWNLPYTAKDVIIDRQTQEKNPKYLVKSIENRIDEITSRLEKKLKPNGKMTANNIEKRQEFLQKHLEELEGRLNEQ